MPNTLNADQIRIACAEVLGVQYHKPTKEEIFSGSYYQYEPAYDTDANAALELVERLSSRGWVVHIARFSGYCMCSATHHEHKREQSDTPTIPLAIAEVFLKIHGKWKE